MRKGFTLIELLIVLSIISALMAVATPTGINALKQAKATNVAGNFRTLNQAVLQMLTLEPNPPTTGDILDYIYTQGHISTKPSGFTITYKSDTKEYIIKYMLDDIDPTRVKNIFNSLEIDSDGKLILRVPKP
ncbi:MAG: prepilin-type N-terminal cleavage/methylation domain-containing protein [Fervidobacterium sp.]|uniref:type II secretion system protein n=1 Tax=Fervidobacterium TaxID=2422 RepID=UPI0022039D76|nr:N-terminal cleavage protein [Fervidobacterium riparium]